MDHAIAFTGGLLACVAAALATDLLLAWLGHLAERSRRAAALPMLRSVLAALIGALLGEGLPLLWPALMPWRSAVLGVSVGLAFGAMRIGGSLRIVRRRAATPSATPPGAGHASNFQNDTRIER